MNRIAMAVAVIISSMQLVFACPKDSVEWKGNCAIEIKAESAPSVVPSDEKPPRSGMPSWQNPSVHAIDLENIAIAEGHHPSTCPSNCYWSGAICSCNKSEPEKGKSAK